MPGPMRSNTVLTLDRLRLAVARNNSAARRSGDAPAGPIISAAQAQARAARDISQPR